MRSSDESSDPAPTPAPRPGSAPNADSCSLTLDGSLPHLAWVDSSPIRITPSEARLLWALARRPRHVLPLDTLYRAIYADAIVEPGQIHWFRCRLDRKLRQRTGRSLLIAVPRCGIYLDLPPRAVAISGDLSH
jgi:DNA-binding winged helix-turn-helix (wHTH) protein